MTICQGHAWSLIEFMAYFINALFSLTCFCQRLICQVGWGLAKEMKYLKNNIIIDLFCKLYK